MDNNTFSNETILAWLNFFSNGTLIDLEHVKILDITRKNKNVVPCSRCMAAEERIRL